MGEGDQTVTRRQFLATALGAATASTAGCITAPTGTCAAQQRIACLSEDAGTTLFKATGTLGIEKAELRRTSEGLQLVILDDRGIHRPPLPDVPPVYFDWDAQSNRLLTASDGSLYVYQRPWNEPTQVTDGTNDTVPWFHAEGPIFRRDGTAYRIPNLDEYLQSSSGSNQTAPIKEISANKSQVRDHPWMSGMMWQGILRSGPFINRVIDGYRIVTYPDSHPIGNAPCVSYTGPVPHMNFKVYPKGESTAIFNLHFGGYFDGDELQLIAWENKYSALCKTLGIGKIRFAKIAEFITAQLRLLRQLAKAGSISNAAMIYQGITTVGVPTLVFLAFLTWVTPMMPPPP